ncbi:response regulator [Mongoliitalea daihaiensis]|nr:response regulator [Mongoliitalea daihaiensis]
MNTNILIVEDDNVFCKLLTRFLSKKGFLVKDAQDGKTALKLIEQEEFSIGIFDYRLPDMDGIEILQIIKEKNPTTKVVIMTRYGDEGIAHLAIAKGADAFIAKPINPIELLEVIQGI